MSLPIQCAMVMVTPVRLNYVLLLRIMNARLILAVSVKQTIPIWQMMGAMWQQVVSMSIIRAMAPAQQPGTVSLNLVVTVRATPLHQTGCLLPSLLMKPPTPIQVQPMVKLFSLWSLMMMRPSALHNWRHWITAIPIMTMRRCSLILVLRQRIVMVMKE